MEGGGSKADYSNRLGWTFLPEGLRMINTWVEKTSSGRFRGKLLWRPHHASSFEDQDEIERANLCARQELPRICIISPSEIAGNREITTTYGAITSKFFETAMWDFIESSVRIQRHRELYGRINRRPNQKQGTALWLC
jgi:hypothetical protein